MDRKRASIITGVTLAFGVCLAAIGAYVPYEALMAWGGVIILLSAAVLIGLHLPVERRRDRYSLDKYRIDRAASGPGRRR